MIAQKYQPVTPRTHHVRDIDEVVHVPYRANAKPAAPAHCKDCLEVLARGRGASASKKQRQSPGPACLRTHNQDAAGTVSIAGAFFHDNRDMLLNHARNEAAKAREANPLERIMARNTQTASLVIETTDIHLARRIREALYRAYHGDLSVKYSPDHCRIRVAWSREV